jgi:N6-L-threonylcarbamoyladenine synthase
MIILSIETSCDETAISIIEAVGDFPHAEYKILGNSLFSQIDIHREYGGVFPAVAKREHAKMLVPCLQDSLRDAELLANNTSTLSQAQTEKLHEILHREPGLGDVLIAFLENNSKPHIDLIAVTSGPGLEPALWVGINFARALSYIWNIPLVPINHMEGHILSSLFTDDSIPQISFPALALLISGGHTELDLMKIWGDYTCVGETRDDAVGEAFDKVARMLGLQYPGGPEVSSRARRAREENLPSFVKLPRPMLDSDDLDFSFSGLKTAVRYAIEGKSLTEDEIASIACEFENAVTEVLLKKTERAIDEHGIQTLIIGGGVSANTYIRESFTSYFKETYPDLALYFPEKNLSTDNSVMIAFAGHAQAPNARPFSELGLMSANGNLSLDSKEV